MQSRHQLPITASAVSSHFLDPPLTCRFNSAFKKPFEALNRNNSATMFEWP
jgi:hypothetical protein